MKPNSTLYQRLRGVVREEILNILGAWATPTPGIHILNGHRIATEKEPDTFRNLLENLSHNVSFIRIEEAVECIMRKECPDTPLVAFTFDDGFMECYDIFAPKDYVGVKSQGCKRRAGRSYRLRSEKKPRPRT